MKEKDLTQAKKFILTGIKKQESEIKQKGIYWCNKCQRPHKKRNTKIFKDHIKEAADISDYELNRLQIKRNWKRCKKEQDKYGAVNLPKRRIK